MSAIEIIKGMKLPSRAPGVRKTKYPFDRMAIEEAFFVPGKTAVDFASYAGQVGRKLGRRFTTRTMFMRKVEAEWMPCAAGEDGATEGCLVMRGEDPE